MKKVDGLTRVAALALAAMVFTAPAGAQDGVYRVNCGGKKVDSWSRDPATNGAVVKTVASIAKAKYAPQAVYQCARQAPKITYSFPALSNGCYRVNLHFAELVYDQAGRRVAQVKIEGAKALNSLDIYSRAGGKNRALRLAFSVMVLDGNGLQVQVARKAGDSALVNGIEVIPTPPPGDMVFLSGGTNSGVNPLAPEEAYTLSYPNLYSLSVRPFAVSRAEVTKAQWDEVRAWALTNGYPDLPEGGGKAADHPVQAVNWFDCVKWCNARSQREGRTPAYYTDLLKTTVVRTGTSFDAASNAVNWASGYRLPTSAEWEFAGRAGLVGARFPWGDTITHSNANYFSTDTYPYDVSETRGYHPAFATNGTPYTGPVDALPANGFGLYGMAGNVSEWCWNWHPNGIGSQRVVRGGDYDFNAGYSRVGFFNGIPPDSRWESLGFRLVLPVP